VGCFNASACGHLSQCWAFEQRVGFTSRRWRHSRLRAGYRIASRVGKSPVQVDGAFRCSGAMRFQTGPLAVCLMAQGLAICAPHPKIFSRLFRYRPDNVANTMPASNYTMRQHESLPVVICPGCKLPMVVKERRRARSSKLTTAVFRCAQCGMETERDFKDGAR
jgi:hypothetical protein